ncbi:hypothetical protein BKA59DRAFT_277032 [Fusarium tricinctum]|uniref:Uncharacterized protein n=1 Tax=Fusarium tricinctum TaxID=61284 RepID=A0A8K0W9H9_9HYPO|nr:hypothetical protein BKA59DRAFT_277032 [Fusarium tricinctum]
MANIQQHTETNDKTLEIDSSAPGTIVRIALAAESVVNVFMAASMIFNPIKNFENTYLTDGQPVVSQTASLSQQFGPSILAMTVPMMLALPNKPGAIELRRISYQILSAYEILAVPITLWQAWVAGEAGSGLNFNKVIWGLTVPMGVALGFRAWVLFLKPEWMGKYKTKRDD